ncbi:hypothetical protein ACFLWL_00420 [Chloroflexota bacterium]
MTMCFSTTSTTSEASSLKEHIGSIFDKKRVHTARLGPALGVHSSPDTLGVIVREQDK